MPESGTPRPADAFIGGVLATSLHIQEHPPPPAVAPPRLTENDRLTDGVRPPWCRGSVTSVVIGIGRDTASYCVLLEVLVEESVFVQDHDSQTPIVGFVLGIGSDVDMKIRSWYKNIPEEFIVTFLF